ncbi:unnamed protein product [Tilletia caries]|nr:hypothetical protein CF336_g4013 [Tilletia laevis]KAE8205031.1 hypothetical protein CF335_g2458 [Tilletia laevis]CAD6898380.1 unnamed protein product [Tilletia caries]CAD6943954.1 unnamed protein product [Tilletia controversa]CAD7067790.1 unnamed protein product [Tilletia caries]
MSYRLAECLLDATATEPYFSTWAPKLLASITVFVARKMVRRPWALAFVTTSGRTEHELTDEANMLLAYLRSDSYRHSYMYRKYTSNEYEYVGDYVHSWAATHPEI